MLKVPVHCVQCPTKSEIWQNCLTESNQCSVEFQHRFIKEQTSNSQLWAVRTTPQETVKLSKCIQTAILLLDHRISLCKMNGSSHVNGRQFQYILSALGKARDSEWQWHQLGHTQSCTLTHTYNHSSIPPIGLYRPDALPAAKPTASKHWRHYLLSKEHSVHKTWVWVFVVASLLTNMSPGKGQKVRFLRYQLRKSVSAKVVSGTAGHKHRSSVNFGGRHFCPKMCEKLIKCAAKNGFQNSKLYSTYTWNEKHNTVKK